MLSGTNINKYNDLQLYYSSHEGELYITDDKSIIIKVYYFDNIDPDFDSIIKICDISMKVSKLIPNYVPEIYLRYETNYYIALVMDRINGITLNEYLESRQNYTINISSKIVISLYEAVFAFHNGGYIHGDLHGNNIIIHDDYKVKLIDFGESDLVGSMSASDENIPKIYQDYLYLKYYVALLIFPTLEIDNVATVIKIIRDFTVKDVIGYYKSSELANRLFNILNSFPKAIEDNI